MIVSRKNKLSKEAIEKRNEAFWKLPAAEQRVAIAQDVLNELSARRMNAKRDIYVYFGDYCLPKGSEEDSLQDHLEKMPSCDVCAKGALFVSAVRLGNRFKCGEIVDGVIDEDDINYVDFSNFKDFLRDIFSSEQLELIEYVFERGIIGDVDSAEITKADAFIDHYLSKDANWADDEAMMIAIMKNIIKNKGTFIP